MTKNNNVKYSFETVIEKQNVSNTGTIWLQRQ